MTKRTRESSVYVLTCRVFVYKSGQYVDDSEVVYKDEEAAYEGAVMGYVKMLGPDVPLAGYEADTWKNTYKRIERHPKCRYPFEIKTYDVQERAICDKEPGMISLGGSTVSDGMQKALEGYLSCFSKDWDPDSYIIGIEFKYMVTILREKEGFRMSLFTGGGDTFELYKTLFGLFRRVFDNRPKVPLPGDLKFLEGLEDTPEHVERIVNAIPKVPSQK